MNKDALDMKEIRKFLALQQFIKNRKDITEYFVMLREGYSLIPIDIIYAKDHAEAVTILMHRKDLSSEELRKRYELVCLLKGSTDNFVCVFGDPA